MVKKLKGKFVVVCSSQLDEYLQCGDGIESTAEPHRAVRNQLKNFDDTHWFVFELKTVIRTTPIGNVAGVEEVELKPASKKKGEKK